jgi:hypothetical protein
MTGRRRSDRGVPPLRNEDVTGMTKQKQDEVIRESGTTPDRRDAADEFLDEQRDQAGDTASSAARRGAADRTDAAGGDHPGLIDREEGTELEKHWDPESVKER